MHAVFVKCMQRKDVEKEYRVSPSTVYILFKKAKKNPKFLGMLALDEEEKSSLVTEVVCSCAGVIDEPGDSSWRMTWGVLTTPPK